MLRKMLPVFIVLLCVLFTACGPKEKAAEPTSAVEPLSSSETQTSLVPPSSAAPNTSQPAPASSVTLSNTFGASSFPKTTPAKKENASINQNAPYVFKLPETGLEIKHINQQYKIADSSNLKRNFFAAS